MKLVALKQTCFECPFKILVGFITFPQSSWNGKNSTTCSTCYSTARYSANSCTGNSDFLLFLTRSQSPPDPFLAVEFLKTSLSAKFRFCKLEGHKAAIGNLNPFLSSILLYDLVGTSSFCLIPKFTTLFGIDYEKRNFPTIV